MMSITITCIISFPIRYFFHHIMLSEACIIEIQTLIRDLFTVNISTVCNQICVMDTLFFACASLYSDTHNCANNGCLLGRTAWVKKIICCGHDSLLTATKSPTTNAYSMLFVTALCKSISHLRLAFFQSEMSTLI